MLIHQVPNLNHYPVNPHDDRFGFLPFVGGLAVGALAGGIGGPRPCCGPPMPMPMPMPMPVPPQFVPVPIQTLPAQLPQPVQSFQTIQGPFLESNKFFIQ